MMGLELPGEIHALADQVFDVAGAVFAAQGVVTEERFRRGAGAAHVVREAEQIKIAAIAGDQQKEIGRASCRERVCQYVSISVVAVSLKKKKATIDLI